MAVVVQAAAIIAVATAAQITLTADQQIIHMETTLVLITHTVVRLILHMEIITDPIILMADQLIPHMGIILALITHTVVQQTPHMEVILIPIAHMVDRIQMAAVEESNISCLLRRIYLVPQVAKEEMF